MIIGKRRLKQLKLILVSSTLDRITVISYLVVIPLMMTYEIYGLGQQPLSLNQIRTHFQVTQWENCSTIQDAFNYLTNIFMPKYYVNQPQANQIPLHKLIISQTRSPDYNCSGDIFDCEYGDEIYTEIIFSPKNETLCIEENCLEFTKRNNIFGGQSVGIDGHYQTYSNIKYFTIINISDNYTEIFQNLKQNEWVDDQTESILIFGSVFDLASQQQIQIVFLTEQQFSDNPLFSTVQFYQLPFFDFSDTLHTFLFCYLIFIGLLKTFRTILELSYIFSRFNLIFQMYNFISLLIFCIVHFQVLIIRNQDDDYNLLFSRDLLNQQFNGKIITVGTALKVNNYHTTIDFARVLLLISFPFSFLQFILFFNFEWVQNYHTLALRTLPGVIISSILIVMFYFITIIPQSLIEKQSRIQHHSLNYILYFFTQVFMQSYQYNENERKGLTMVVECLQFIFLGIIGIYIIGLSIEAFRKSSLIEMPYQSKYEKEFVLNFEQLNIKLSKTLKQIQKLFIKDKQPKDKKNNSRREDERQSQILDDELLSDISDLKPDKILIVFEIHNTFLEEINRYKARRDANQYAQKRDMKRSKIKEQQSQKVGIIQQLLQKDKVNQRLQVMLSKYQSNDIQYNQLPEEQNDQQQYDFFSNYQEQIFEQGVTIRQFFVIDQVIQFLEMLLRLRPEFLSLNAEQRIRIMFYINSDQIEEEDVYKLLSFLIVNLAKQHLNYPILVFSQHKEWYIEKEQYLKLKKFYRNIFSTLEKECAVEFSLMKTSFFDFQLIFSKDQQFYEKEIQEEISNSVIEEGEDKSELL